MSREQPPTRTARKAGRRQGNAGEAPRRALRRRRICRPATCSAPRPRKAPRSASRRSATWTQANSCPTRSSSASSRSAWRPAVRSATASCSTVFRARCIRPRELDRVLGGRPLDIVDRPRRAARDRARPHRGPARVRELPARVPREHAADARLDRATPAAATCASATTTPKKRSNAGSSCTRTRRCRSSTTTGRAGCLTVVDGVGDGDDVFERLVKVVDEQLRSDAVAEWSCARRRRRSRIMRQRRRGRRRDARGVHAGRQAGRDDRRSRRARRATCSTGASARSNFLGYHGFPAVACISPNEVIVHGIPGDRVLEDGDIVSIDCGAIIEGWHADAAITVPVGRDRRRVAAPDRRRPGRRSSRDRGHGRGGNRLGDVGAAVEGVASAAGFGGRPRVRRATASAPRCTRSPTSRTTGPRAGA